MRAIPRPRVAVALAALFGVLLAPSAKLHADQATIDRSLAVIEALDKVTARVTRLTVPVGDAVTFRTLTITVRACRATPASERPDNAVFLEIDDAPPEGAPYRAFSGWMFSSSPSISAMRHPVYDIRLASCTDPGTAPAPGAPSTAPAGAAPFTPPIPPPRPSR